IRTSNAKAYLTIKGKTTSATRQEYEYEIPFQDAQELLQLCETSIRKIRYHVWLEQHLWEIDVFSGSNEGLILAEIELNDENEVFKKPSWLGDEVTSDSRYYNVNLLKNPFKNWHH
ncbi:MAG: CYTH domain-containing protein, partial [Bacteroidetes bacterium]|nr:CYTH domain-containing protein [Bacteroidota bacterium]